VGEDVSVTARPLGETFERLTSLDPYLGAVVDDVRAASVRVWGDTTDLETAFDRIGTAWNTSDRRVQAAFLVNDYTWRIAAPAVAAFVLDRRVPDLAPDAVVMTLAADGTFEPPVFGSTSYAGAVADTGAAATMSTDELLRVLRRGIEDHLRPLVRNVRRVAPLGERGQWALIGDACGSCFLRAGQVVGEASEERRWAERFLALDGEPLRGRQRFFVLRDARREATFMTRGSCCLVYRVDGHGYCATCPFTPDDERERRLLEYLASPD